MGSDIVETPTFINTTILGNRASRIKRVEPTIFFTSLAQVRRGLWLAETKYSDRPGWGNVEVASCIVHAGSIMASSTGELKMEARC